MDNQQISPVYRAVFFDLDGTLLPMELEEFMGSYFKALGGYAAAHGLDVERFMTALKRGIRAMAHHETDITNEQAFFQEFFRTEDEAAKDWSALFQDFYANEFGAIGAGVKPDPFAAQAIETLAEKGYALALTTMPMFPLTAVRWRLKWAGVEPAAFCRITTFENSRSVKPKLTYYAENLAACGVRGADVLMVGNNTVEDMAALDMGTDGYLVTDHLLDPVDFDMASVKHGSMRDFAAWVQKLPACANPAVQVQRGVIEAAEVERAYEANVVVRRNDEQSQRTAAKAYVHMRPEGE